MRAYSAPNEEALRARHLLKDWAGEDFLTDAQYRRMEQETVCEFRSTNIFLRIVLFLFTLLVVAAAVALFFAFLVPDSERRNPGFLLLFLAAVSYAATEALVSLARLHRYGIEEALAVCSIGFLCAGMQFAFSIGLNSRSSDKSEFFVLAAGAIASLWIWRRFGFSYAFFAAMIFVIFLPSFWTSSAPAQHLILAAIYAAGLVTIAAIRDRYRLTYSNHEYSIVEALLWLGIYLSINLQTSPVDLLGIWRGDVRNVDQISRPFYWLTWVLIWCLPPIVLTRGIRRKDRLVIAVGAILAVVTLATNKPYLGWQRHTWDPMLLGALLIGVALFIRRWLAQAPDGVRYGFTAQRLSGKDKNLLNAGAGVFGVVAPHAMPVSQQPESPQFGGGDSGGGGASSDF